VLTKKYLFEIPVYRLAEKDYYKELSDYENGINSELEVPLSNTYLKKQYGGDWRYNEIIGFLRFYRYGGNQIRCDYTETDAVRKTRTRKKVFEKISDNYCTESFTISSSNMDLVECVKSAVEHCEIRLKKKHRVLDKELFENTVDFIDWKSLLK
jgi:hypothetical protein